MRDELMNTEVEIWRSDAVRVEDHAFQQYRCKLIELHPPRILKTVELPLGATLEIGRKRKTGSSRRFDITDSDTGVSRTALTLGEGTASTTVTVGQVDGVFVQTWGSQGSWLRPKGTVDNVFTLPTSFRIESDRYYYWVLVNPCARVVPVQYQPIVEDDEVDTDGKALALPHDSPIHAKLETALPHLRHYFWQFLEWPPRVLPEGGIPKGEKDAGRKLIGSLGSALSEIGFPKWDGQSRTVELLERLVQHRLIDMDEERLTRTEVIRPTDKQKKIKSGG